MIVKFTWLNLTMTLATESYRPSYSFPERAKCRPLALGVRKSRNLSERLDANARRPQALQSAVGAELGGREEPGLRAAVPPLMRSPAPAAYFRQSSRSYANCSGKMARRACACRWPLGVGFIEASSQFQSRSGGLSRRTVTEIVW